MSCPFPWVVWVNEAIKTISNLFIFLWKDSTRRIQTCLFSFIKGFYTQKNTYEQKQANKTKISEQKTTSKDKLTKQKQTNKKKNKQTKQKGSILLGKKSACLRLVLFVLFVLFELFVPFVRVEFFRKEINGLKMVLMVSFTHTTELLPQKNFLAVFADTKLPKTPFRETPWLTGRHVTPSVTLFFIITMLLTGHHAMPVAI